MFHLERFASRALLSVLTSLVAVTSKSIESGIDNKITQAKVETDFHAPKSNIHFPNSMDSIAIQVKKLNSPGKQTLDRQLSLVSAIQKLKKNTNSEESPDHKPEKEKPIELSKVAKDIKFKNVMIVHKKALRFPIADDRHTLCIPTERSGCKDGATFGAFQCMGEDAPRCPCRCPTADVLKNLLPLDYTLIQNGGHLSTKRRPEVE